MRLHGEEGLAQEVHTDPYPAHHPSASLPHHTMPWGHGRAPATRLTLTDGVAGGKRASWVHVHSGGLPRHVLGRFHAVLAYLRCVWAALALLLSGACYDVVVVDQVSSWVTLRARWVSLRACWVTPLTMCCAVVDQVSAPVPLLRWFSSSKVPLPPLLLRPTRPRHRLWTWWTHTGGGNALVFQQPI